jgi:hypothetical protein
MNISTPATQQPANKRPTPKRPHPLAMLRVFVGLLPLLLAIPPFALGLWAIGLLIYVGGSVIFLGSQVTRHKTVGSLDICSLAFGVGLTIGYFGFGNTYFLHHFGMVINTLLLVQVVYGELRGTPWTAQFAKRMYSPEQYKTRAFFLGNRLLSRMWGVIFVLDVLMSALGTTALFQFILPNVLLIVALVAGPFIGAWYGKKADPMARAS